MCDSNKWCVYIHINKVNLKCYIGITSNEPKRRWGAGSGYNSNKYFKRAIDKYGWKNFYHVVLHSELVKQDAQQLEIFYIKLFDSKSPNGYNLSSGGEGASGYRHSLETREKMSKAQMGNKHNLGKKLSEETKRKIGDANRGKVSIMSDKTREKMSKARKGEGSWAYGKKFTEEHRRNLSENHADMSGGKHPMAKKVVFDGILFDCMINCGRYLCVNEATLRKWLKGYAKIPDRFSNVVMDYYQENIHIRVEEYDVEKHGETYLTKQKDGEK